MKKYYLTFIILLLVSNSSFSKTISWIGCGITKQAFMKDLSRAFEKKTGIKFNISGGGATKGIRYVNKKWSDIGGSCRHKLKRSGKVIEKEAKTILIPVAWDAIVLITHASNKINNLSLNQIREIYLGRTTKWGRQTDTSKDIKLITRKGLHSGVGNMFRQFVFKDSNIIFKNVFLETSSTGPLELFIEKHPFTLAADRYSSAIKRKVKILKINNIEPNIRNISSGAYPLFRPLYLTINKENLNREDIQAFIKYAYSEEGKNIIRKNKSIPYKDAPHLKLKIQEKFPDIIDVLW